MVAGAEEAVQWPRAACIAPICGFLRPGWTTISLTTRSSANVKALRHVSQISAHSASSSSIEIPLAFAAAGLIQIPGVGFFRNSARLTAAGWRRISSLRRSTSVFRGTTAISRRPSRLRRNSPRSRFSVNSFAEAISLQPGWPSFLTKAPWILPAIANCGGSEISRSSLKSVSTSPPGKWYADPDYTLKSSIASRLLQRWEGWRPLASRLFHKRVRTEPICWWRISKLQIYVLSKGALEGQEY